MGFKQFVGNTVNVIKVNSPTILLGVGITMLVGTAVLASVETLKAKKVMDTKKAELAEKTADAIASEQAPTEKELKKIKQKVVLSTVGSLAKTYAPSVATCIVGVTCLLASYKILNGRYVAASAAYAVLNKAFLKLQKNVEKKYGHDEMVKLRDEEVEYEVEEVEEIDKETGEVKMVKKVKETTVKDSPFSWLYSKETTTSWDANTKYNYQFLKNTEGYFTDLLRTRTSRTVTLFEVLDYLDLVNDDAKKAHPEIFVLGWYYDPKNPNHCGDNYVDFGMDDPNDPQKRAFACGENDAIWLEFNCDGSIMPMTTK